MKQKPKIIKRIIVNKFDSTNRILFIQWATNDELQWIVGEVNGYGTLTVLGTKGFLLSVSLTYDYDEVFQYINSYNDDYPEVDVEVWGDALSGEDDK